MIEMKRLFYILLIAIFSVPAMSQEKDRAWYLPDHYKLQFAGNIGFLSASAGYLHGKGKLETDLYTGFLPEQIGGDHIITMTLKSTYLPWKREIDANYSMKPFAVGLYLSYSFGSQFDTISPNEYPEGYYWWATSLRVGGFIGGSLERKLKEGNRFKSISLYYELGTYDLIFLSYIQNLEHLSITDIVSLSLGLKLKL